MRENIAIIDILITAAYIEYAEYWTVNTEQLNFMR